MTPSIVRGFSLLETLMYIGLFGIIMQSTFAGILAISASAERNQAKAYLAEEGEFFINKISYEITSSSEVNSPTIGTTSTELDLISPQNGDVSIALNKEQFVISRDSSMPMAFSSNQVRVSNVAFMSTSSDLGASSPIQFSFTLQTRSATGQTFSEDFSSVSYPGL